MLKIACIQLTSSDNIAENTAKLQKMAAQAAASGAGLIVTPENSFFMEGVEKGKRELYTMQDHPAVKASAEMARENKVFLLIGSIAVVPENGTDENGSKTYTYNRSILFNPDGEIAAYYDKIHLFDVEVGDGQVYRESAKVRSGDKAVLTTLPLITHPSSLLPKIGLTICYDLRFPQLFRTLAKAGANIIAVPAAFTKVTGEAHWHTLLRARAIETGSFIIAPAQTGTHPGGRQTFGHSLIVDPWGKIMADGGEGEGITTTKIDLEEVEKTRSRLPSLKHDREFTTISF